MYPNTLKSACYFTYTIITMCNKHFYFATLFTVLCRIQLFNTQETNETSTIIVDNTTTARYQEILAEHVVCKLQPNGYDCSEAGRYRSRFYYDIKMQDCKTTRVGSCDYNENSFGSRKACRETCQDAGLEFITEALSPTVYCRLQPDFGNCNKYYPMWYFDVTERTCRGFSFSGCGGNMNRFHERHVCTMTCANLEPFQN